MEDDTKTFFILERLINLATRQDMNKLMSDFDENILECYEIHMKRILKIDEDTQPLLDKIMADKRKRIEDSKR